MLETRRSTPRSSTRGSDLTEPMVLTSRIVLVTAMVAVLVTTGVVVLAALR